MTAAYVGTTQNSRQSHYGYPEPVCFGGYAHVRIIAGTTRHSSGIMKDLGAAPDTLHTGLSQRPGSANLGEMPKSVVTVDIT